MQRCLWRFQYFTYREGSSNQLPHDPLFSLKLVMMLCDDVLNNTGHLPVTAASYQWVSIRAVPVRVLMSCELEQNVLTWCICFYICTLISCFQVSHCKFDGAGHADLSMSCMEVAHRKEKSKGKTTYMLIANFKDYQPTLWMPFSHK